MDVTRTNATCVRCEQLRQELAALRKQFERVQRRTCKLEQQNAQLKEELEEADRNAKRQTVRFPRRKRKANPQKPGRKPGTKATHREAPVKVDRQIDVPVTCCPDCECGLVDIQTFPQYQTDLPPVEPTTVQFNVQVGWCPLCGKRVQGRHPEQISDALGAAGNVVGPNTHAMATELKHHSGLSYAKISNFLLSHFQLKTAASTFIRAGQRFARRALPTFEFLKDALRLEHVVHADETGWRIGLVSDWLWVFSSPRVTIYHIGGGRGQEVPRKILGSDFEGILVSDGLATYDPLPYLKGRCLSHVLARISRLKETQRNADILDLESLEALLHETMDLGSRRDELTVGGYRRRIRELENRLDVWLLLNEEHRSRDIARLARHLAKHRAEWFMFLYDPSVPPTNNHAERMIRPAVILRKLGGCNKTDMGAMVHSVWASLIVSCRQQGKRFPDLAHRILHAPDPQPIPLVSLPDG